MGRKLKNNKITKMSLLGIDCHSKRYGPASDILMVFFLNNYMILMLNRNVKQKKGYANISDMKGPVLFLTSTQGPIYIL